MRFWGSHANDAGATYGGPALRCGLGCRLCQHLNPRGPWCRPHRVCHAFRQQPGVGLPKLVALGGAVVLLAAAFCSRPPLYGLVVVAGAGTLVLAWVLFDGRAPTLFTW